MIEGSWQLSALLISHLSPTIEFYDFLVCIMTWPIGQSFLLGGWANKDIQLDSVKNGPDIDVQCFSIFLNLTSMLTHNLVTVDVRAMSPK